MTGAALETAPSIITSPAASNVAAPRPRKLGDVLRVPVVASLVLLAIYAALSFTLNDPRGTLGTDTGGKLATLHMMEQRGGLDPDIGYWAAASDPDGELHPLYYTFRVEDKWVNATTLPMLYAAYPLFVVGGDRGVLLLPMMGALFCALGARALARRLGARTGWPAFWVVGLVTPVAIYALDYWEHTLGLGLMLWGFVCFFDVAERGGAWHRALVGGLLFGAAATMRTEALVYFAVAGLATCVVLWRKGSLVRAAERGLTMAGGLVVPLVLNQVLEHATLGGSMRAGRASSTANGAGAGLSTRVREALMTTLGLNRFELNVDLVFGGLIVALIVYGAWRLRRDDRSAWPIGVIVIVIAATFVMFRFTSGLGFVSGMLTASPFAAVGLFLGWRRTTRFPLLVAIVALPLVWAFQYSGGAGPQWGGRYVLLSGALLAVVGIVALEGRRAAFVAVVTVSALLTGFGIAWLSQRSTTTAEGFEAIVARHDQAVISVEAHALREGGAFYTPDRHWLTATTERERDRAVEIVTNRGHTQFALVASEGTRHPETIGGFTKSATQRVAFLRPDIHLEVVTYERR